MRPATTLATCLPTAQDPVKLISGSRARLMLFQETSYEPPDFSGRGGIEVVAKLNESVTIVLRQAQNQLAIFAILLLGLRHLCRSC